MKRAVNALGVALAAIAHEWLAPGTTPIWGNHWNYALKKALYPLLVVALDRPIPRPLDRGLGLLAELSFGIYFVHVAGIEVATVARAFHCDVTSGPRPRAPTRPVPESAGSVQGSGAAERQRGDPGGSRALWDLRLGMGLTA